MKRFLPVYMNVRPGRVLLPANTAPAFSVYTCSFFKLLFFSLSVLIAQQVIAQTADNAAQNESYKKVITERALKIVNTLSITDSVKYNKVVTAVADQYYALGNAQEQNTQAIAAIKNEAADKDKQAAALKEQEEKKSAALMQLHNQFIAHLNNHLTEDQVEKVKDGMTYKILPITYAAYQDMIPTLKATEKEKIYGWLKEARELAMDAESSDKKHAVFGKYKGRINNYLSAAGYDVKKEGGEWQKRIKEREKKKEPVN
ncbi:MAG: DUF3826 domain-containing protein [Chitinophagaceae bacterium]